MEVSVLWITNEFYYVTTRINIYGDSIRFKMGFN